MPARGSDPSIPLSLLKQVAEKGFESKLAELQEAERKADVAAQGAESMSKAMAEDAAALDKERQAFESEKAKHAEFVQQMDHGFDQKQVALDERKTALDNLRDNLEQQQAELADGQKQFDTAMLGLRHAEGQVLEDRKSLENEWAKLEAAKTDLAAREQRLQDDLKNIGSRLEGLKLTA